MWSPSFKLRSEQLNICLRRRTSLGLSCRLLENTQTAASPTTQSLQWTDIQVSDEELEADKAVPGMCSIVWGGLGLWSHVKQWVCWFSTLPNQTCYSISLITPRFPQSSQDTIKHFPSDPGVLVFSPGLLFPPFFPMHLGKLLTSHRWPFDPYLYISDLCGGHSRSEYEAFNSVPIDQGCLTHTLFFNGVVKLHIWPREFQIFLFCNVWCLY